MSIVGDIDAAEVEVEVLRYLGTVQPQADSAPLAERPIKVLSPPREERHVRWHLQVRVPWPVAASFNAAAGFARLGSSVRPRPTTC